MYIYFKSEWIIIIYTEMKTQNHNSRYIGRGIYEEKMWRMRVGDIIRKDQ